MARFGAPLPLLLASSLLLAACGDEGGRESSATSPITGASSVTITGASVTVTTASASASASGTEGSSGGATDSATGTGGSASGGSMTECNGDDECPPGEHCGTLSGKCLADGECIYFEDCEGGKTCVDGKCVIGGECGAQGFNLTKLPPNVMIVLDRSGSMDGDVQDSNKTRWEVAKDAIFALVDAFNNDIRFGLVTYSACKLLEECTAGEVVVPIIDKASNLITGFLQGKGLEYLCNSGMPETSTGNTLAARIGDPTLQDPSRGNAIILITDGGESSECKDKTDGQMAAAALYGQAIPVKTYAVGFSDGIIGSLAEIAAAGGTQTPYNANNPQSLQDALNAIAANVASCDFVLDGDPPDMDEIFVFFDDDPAGIPYDPVNGWTYDPDTKTIHFHGEACEKLKNGEVVDIDVVYGCNAPIPG
ncbi:MAG: VWA domain-containing protein [Myxococcales bacterium]|nr:VWA domain-containing protein [Myxococcales bacterium]